MLRVGRSKWFNLLWLLPIGFALLVAGVAVAQALRELPSVEAFVEKYPGTFLLRTARKASLPGQGGSTPVKHSCTTSPHGREVTREITSKES
jgi:hypothetical protein